MRRHFFKQIVAATAAIVLTGASAQDSYPQKPLHLIVPFPAGGIVDIVGRELAERMSSELGQPVLVENRSMELGAAATEVVAKAEPDGLTLVLATSGHAIQPALRKLPFDPVRDFTPIAMVADVPQVITVPKSMGVSTLQEFTDLVRSKPGKLSFASSGNGSLLHLIGEQYKRRAPSTTSAVTNTASRQLTTQSKI